MGFPGRCTQNIGEAVVSSRLSFPISAGGFEERGYRGLFNTSSCSVDIQGRPGMSSWGSLPGKRTCFSTFNVFSSKQRKRTNSKFLILTIVGEFPSPSLLLGHSRGISSPISPQTQKGQELWLARHHTHTQPELLLPVHCLREPPAACDSGRHILTCLTHEHHRGHPTQATDYQQWES